jgi:signal transduction histidine kinase
MRLRTLAGRIAAIQTVVTLLALTAVVVATTVTVTALLNRRADRGLRDIAARVAALIDSQDPTSFSTPWIEREIDEIRPTTMQVEIRDRAGRVLAATGPALKLLDADAAAPGCHTRDTTRMCAITAGAFVVSAAASEADDLATRDAFLIAMLIVTGLAAALVAFSSRAVARRGLRPLSQLSARISALDPGSGKRLAMDCGIVELDSLAARFDDLVVRFDDALARERRLTAQASHELRTPLTVARAEIDALASPVDAHAVRQRALAALDRLAELVEILLWFARAQARLDDAAMDDERLLCRVAANLIDNAVKHGDGGAIELRAERDAGLVRFSVMNRGRLAAERVFEPFYRGPRAAGSPGFGLGLPFARAVARAHGGDLVVGTGGSDETVLVLRLPVLAWSDTLEGL